MHYLVVDFEMSGDDPSWHEIIQIGAVLYDTQWKELGRYSTNVYPENEEAFSSPSAEIHGLSLNMLRDAPMMNEVLPAFEEWMCKCRGIRPDPFDNSRLLRDTLICGLGIVNDFAFLKLSYQYENRRWPFSYRILDMQTLTLVLFPLLRRLGIEPPKKQSLEAIAGFFGLEREGYDHNALEDALLTGQCFLQIMRIVDHLGLRDDFVLISPGRD